MRGKVAAALAVRNPQGQIVLKTERLSAAYRGPLSRIPFVRGLLMLWDAFGLGLRSLTYSANIAGGEDVQFEGPLAWVTMFFSITFGLALFFLGPAAVGSLAEGRLSVSAWAGNLIEGLVRLALIVGYIWAIGFIPDIRRLFGYHGAEHKTINAFEAGDELTPETVARYPLEHPRCGTAFLLTVVVISVLLFSALGPLPLPVRLISRLLLIPVLAGLAYEYIRFTARHVQNPLVRALIAPNLALQKLTTREPDKDMLEVAIAAFRAMRAGEEHPERIVS